LSQVWKAITSRRGKPRLTPSILIPEFVLRNSRMRNNRLDKDNVSLTEVEDNVSLTEVEDNVSLTEVEDLLKLLEASKAEVEIGHRQAVGTIRTLQDKINLSQGELIQLAETKKQAAQQEQALELIRNEKKILQGNSLEIRGRLEQLTERVKSYVEKKGQFRKKLSEIGKPYKSISFGKAWSIYKRIHQPNNVRNTVVAFGRNLQKKPKKNVL